MAADLQVPVATQQAKEQLHKAILRDTYMYKEHNILSSLQATERNDWISLSGLD